ncbi:site-specific integrase [Arcicella sp. DC2W]|uniref:Site-specific integrase n=1 Tax=Arcicella gelida TaxID=2984195 RepID=A0ABU5S123_9BACT|nr:site-specific integrase [Arcicella sp. DC2W]MEA5402164.1 site-specific integrase [Arcicella sp. DC2W]
MEQCIEYSLRFNRKNHLNKDGKAPVEIRMYQSGKARYKQTGFSVTPDRWDSEKQQPKDKAIKRNCQTLIHELQTFESDFRITNKGFTLKDFDCQNSKVPEPPLKQVSFTQFYTDQLEAERALKQPSWRTRKLTLDYFKEFCVDVKFSEVKYSMIQKFEFFLNTKSLHTNTIAKHHKHIRKYIIQAIKSRLILPQDNPYNDFSVNKSPFKSQFCTEEELKRLEELTFNANEKMLERCRDMFLFGCYTGLRFNDVYKLKPSHFHNTNEGLILEYQANKTSKFGEKYLFKLFAGKPQMIALKYMPLNNTTLFKGLTNPKVNLSLKALAKQANINKPLRFKDSRDTFGTIMISKAPITVVKDEMQHSYLTTTQKYLHLTPEMKKQELSKIKWE